MWYRDAVLEDAQALRRKPAEVERALFGLGRKARRPERKTATWSEYADWIEELRRSPPPS
jgi:hypothetical protein